MNGEQTLNIFIHCHARQLTNNTENAERRCFGMLADQTPKGKWNVSKVSVCFVLVPLSTAKHTRTEASSFLTKGSSDPFNAITFAIRLKI